MNTRIFSRKHTSRRFCKQEDKYDTGKWKYSTKPNGKNSKESLMGMKDTTGNSKSPDNRKQRYRNRRKKPENKRNFRKNRNNERLWERSANFHHVDRFNNCFYRGNETTSDKDGMISKILIWMFVFAAILSTIVRIAQ